MTDTTKLIIFILLIFLIFLNGCNSIIFPTPWVDINEIGTVLESGQSITIESTNGTVVVEYIAPQKRRITWQNESIEITPVKSTYINGLFDTVRFGRQPFVDLDELDYSERTLPFRTKEEFERHKDFLFETCEYRPHDQISVYFDVWGHELKYLWRKTYKKYMVLKILKYKILYEEESEK